MMRYGVSFALDDIFFTHLHGDHVIGVIGLFRTLALQGRKETMRLWGPKGTKRMLREAVHFGVDRIGFPMDIIELEPDDRVARAGYEIVPFAAVHRGTTALGYALVEEERRGRFNPELARELGIPEGPLWGQIHKGQTITLDDGRIIHPELLVGPTRAGRKVVLSGDTRPSETTVEHARDAIVRLQLDDVHREADPVDAEVHRFAQHSLRSLRPPEAHGLLPTLQRERAKQADHADHVVAVQVCEEDVVQRERHSVAHHLPLRPLAAVEHQRLPLANERDGGNPPLNGGAGSGGTKETNIERHGPAIYREREARSDRR
jgi:hypothetical protein